MTTVKHDRKVVTYQSPDSGLKIDICPTCEERLKASGEWPTDGRGRECCQVHRGLHVGMCHYADLSEVEED